MMPVLCMSTEGLLKQYTPCNTISTNESPITFRYQKLLYSLEFSSFSLKSLPLEIGTKMTWGGMGWDGAGEFQGAWMRYQVQNDWVVLHFH